MFNEGTLRGPDCFKESARTADNFSSAPGSSLSSIFAVARYAGGFFFFLGPIQRDIYETLIGFYLAKTRISRFTSSAGRWTHGRASDPRKLHLPRIFLIRKPGSARAPDYRRVREASYYYPFVGERGASARGHCIIRLFN